MRAGQLVRDDGQGVAPQLEALDEVVLRLRELVGHVEVVRAVGERCRVHLERVRLVLAVDRLALVARRAQDVEQPAALGLRQRHELVRVPDVVLHVALLARVQAALERDHEQDEHEDRGAGGYGPADHERLAVGGRTARGTARRAAYRLVRFVEEGQANRS
jgi:hypothetical protein